VTARTGACGVDPPVVLVGGSDLCGGMGRDTALDWFSRLTDGCSTRRCPRGLDISVSGVTAGRESVDEGMERFGG
jgi:hypothetical protein